MASAKLLVLLLVVVVVVVSAPVKGNYTIAAGVARTATAGVTGSTTEARDRLSQAVKETTEVAQSTAGLVKRASSAKSTMDTIGRLVSGAEQCIADAKEKAYETVAEAAHMGIRDKVVHQAKEKANEAASDTAAATTTAAANGEDDDTEVVAEREEMVAQDGTCGSAENLSWAKWKMKEGYCSSSGGGGSSKGNKRKASGTLTCAKEKARIIMMRSPSDGKL